MFDSGTQQTGKIAIRNLAIDVVQALARLAERRDRSIEAEARQALRAWVQPQIQSEQRVKRAEVVGQRLRYLQDEIESIGRSKPASPSRIAEALGWSHASDVESWFAGEAEGGFKQLAEIADLLGCRKDWLVHGEGNPFSSTYTRIPENPAEAVEWLLQPIDGVMPTLYLLRSKSKAGEFAVIKQFSDWNAKTYSTPYHVSDEIGAGGEASLSWLSLILEALYLRYTHSGDFADVNVQGYLVPEKAYSALLEGKCHPMKAIGNAERSCWWEDFWDENQFRKFDEDHYWSGWRSIAEHIFRVVQSRGPMLEQRTRLRAADSWEKFAKRSADSFMETKRGASGAPAQSENEV